MSGTGLDKFVSRINNSWIVSLIVLFLCIVAVLILYEETFVEMVEIWRDHGAFTYGYLILPISLWLLWRKRTNLSYLNPNPELRGLLLLLIFCVVWLIADLLGFSYIKQLASVALLISLFLCVLGASVFKHMLFPLLFLLFLAPPVGLHNYLVPIMMEVSADIAEFLLQITGVSVYREGTTLHTPTGNWYVAPACSGTQYLITSIIIGCVFAYIAYKNNNKRLVFISISALLPIIGNGLRIYSTIMLGALSGLNVAITFDHVFYGLIFFGIIVSVMFFIGSFWWEYDSSDNAKYQSCKTKESNNIFMSSNIYNVIKTGVFVVLISLSFPLVAHKIKHDFTQQPARINIPLAMAGWKVNYEKSSAWYPVIEQARSEMYQSYIKGDKEVVLYVGELEPFFDVSKVSPAGSVRNIESQLKIVERRLTLPIGDFDVKEKVVNSIDINSGGIKKLVIWYWYLFDKTNTINDTEVKVLETISALKGDRKRTYLIVVASPIKSDIQSARLALFSFIYDTLYELEMSLSNSSISSLLPFHFH